MKSVIDKYYVFILGGQVHSSCVLNFWIGVLLILIWACAPWADGEDSRERRFGGTLKKAKGTWCLLNLNYVAGTAPPLFYSLINNMWLLNPKWMHDNKVQNILSPLELRRSEECCQARAACAGEGQAPTQHAMPPTSIQGSPPADHLPSFLFVLNNNKWMIILNAMTPGGGTFLKLELYLILFWKLLKWFSTTGLRGATFLIGGRKIGSENILA